MNNTIKKEVDIDIWITHIPHLLDISRYQNILDSKDYKRYLAFPISSASSQFVVSRAMVRTALSSLSGQKIKPDQWRFEYLSNGKPKAVAPGTEFHAHFNLSHAHFIATVAVSANYELGIDIEPLNPHIQPADIRAVLSESEFLDLLQLAPGERSRELIKLWTLKEAYLKLLGTGMIIDPSRIEVGIKPLRILYDRSYPVGDDLFTRNWVLDLNGKTFSLSLATWITDERNPSITFHLFDPRLDHQKYSQQFTYISKQKKEEWIWNDYIIYSSDAAAPTKHGQP